MIIQQISVFLENKSGRLSEVTQCLAEKNINITALSIADTSEYGILRMVVSDPQEAYSILRSRKFSVSLTDVICVTTRNAPGALAKILSTLTANEVSVEYMYAFAVNEAAYIIIRTESINNTIEVLQKNKVELIGAAEVYKL